MRAGSSFRSSLDVIGTCHGCAWSSNYEGEALSGSEADEVDILSLSSCDADSFTLLSCFLNEHSKNILISSHSKTIHDGASPDEEVLHEIFIIESIWFRK